jgi:NADH:ubiquinone oxidoreductase subunit F (NADH-binding)
MAVEHMKYSVKSFYTLLKASEIRGVGAEGLVDDKPVIKLTLAELASIYNYISCEAEEMGPGRNLDRVIKVLQEFKKRIQEDGTSEDF